MNGSSRTPSQPFFWVGALRASETLAQDPAVGGPVLTGASMWVDSPSQGDHSRLLPQVRVSCPFEGAVSPLFPLQGRETPARLGGVSSLQTATSLWPRPLLLLNLRQSNLLLLAPLLWSFGWVGQGQRSSVYCLESRPCWALSPTPAFQALACDPVTPAVHFPTPASEWGLSASQSACGGRPGRQGRELSEEWEGCLKGQPDSSLSPVCRVSAGGPAWLLCHSQ